MKCGNCGSDQFEHLPIGAILYRNHGRRSQMIAAAVDAVEAAIRSDAPESTYEAAMREAMRPFDRFADQIQAVH